MAECKAAAEPIGGVDINKFAGALRAQRKLLGEEVQAYFLALAGFRDTALEQEAHLGLDGVHLINATELRARLERCRAVISEAEAVSVASKRLQQTPWAAELFDSAELWVTDVGLVWAVLFGSDRGSEPTVLVHARDAELLAGSLASLVADLLPELVPIYGEQEVRAGDRVLIAGGSIDFERVAAARAAYCAYVEGEFGVITTEGMPADEYVAATRVPLANLYSPQKLVSARSASVPISIGAAMQAHHGVSVLGVPGGGKTTLVKRLATAYLSPTERHRFSDDLPDSEIFPLVIRCRELTSPDQPIREHLLGIPGRGEFEQHAAWFSVLVTDLLHRGDVLLLVDGLDEIASDSDRRRFVGRLRRFAANYPNAKLVVTSRPAGFRVVSDALSDIAPPMNLAGLDSNAILSLCAAWHEAIDAGPTSARKGMKVADQILDSPRISEIAQVPLLLMTLLLVHRGSGELPDRRGDLYGKAVEVLLTSWNVEAHDALDAEEILPQLAWVAFEMIEEGRQRISEQDLVASLRRARTAMPELFGRDSLSVAGVLSQVELRSSLLILVGRSEEEGDSQSDRVYEFRHLTFQEYLAGRGVIDAQCPPAVEGQSAEEILRPHVGASRWREVIPLAATHARRRAAPIISMIIDVVASGLRSSRYGEAGNGAELLATCLADGVQIRPELRQRACDVMVEAADWHGGPVVARLVRTPTGADFVDALMRAFLRKAEVFIEAGQLLARLDQPSEGDMSAYYALDDEWLFDLHSRTTRLCRLIGINSTSIGLGEAVRPRPEHLRRAISSDSPEVRALALRAITLLTLLDDPAAAVAPFPDSLLTSDSCDDPDGVALLALSLLYRRTALTVDLLSEINALADRIKATSAEGETGRFADELRLSLRQGSRERASHRRLSPQRAVDKMLSRPRGA